MSKSNPLVSVILPCYNAMDYLEEALDSILNQTHSNLEIIAIDDGSSDTTFEFLTNKSKLDSRIKVEKNETNLKLIATLNKGVQLAKGEYIARIDADDICMLNRIEKQLDFLTSSESDIVGCNVNIIDESSVVLGENFMKNVSSDSTKFSSFLFTPLIHPTVFGKTGIFKAHPYLSEEKSIHTEDYELWCRLILTGYKLSNSEEILVHLRKNMNSVSNTFEDLQKTNFAICAKDHYNAAFDKNCDEETYKVVVNRFETINRIQLKKGFNILKELRGQFEMDSQKTDILVMQKIDILISVIRKGSFSLRVLGAVTLFWNLLKHISNSRVRKYFKLKFK